MKKLVEFWTQHRSDLLALGVLTIWCVGVLGPALWFVPTDGDDLTQLSAVALTANPLAFFTANTPIPNSPFRPLSFISQWLVYQFAGVSGLPNQAINLALHILCMALLYRLLRKSKLDPLLALALSATVAVAPYTLMPAVWVAARPALLVALMLLLVLNALNVTASTDELAPTVVTARNLPMQITLLIVCSVVALLSKESGVVVPAFAAVFALALPRGAWRARSALIAAAMMIFVFYVIIRAVLLPVNTGVMVHTGFLWGIQQYSNWAALPPSQQALAILTNLASLVIAPWLMIFGELGQLLSPSDALSLAGCAISTLALVGLCAKARLTRLQIYALVLIGLNALAHFTIFRYRELYTAQIAIALFVAGAAALRANANRRGWALGILIALLFFNSLWVTRSINWQAIVRYDNLRYLAVNVAQNTLPSLYDRSTVEMVLQRYAGWLHVK